MLALLAAQACGELRQLGEEPVDVPIEFFAWGGQGEGAAVEEFDPEVALELEDLTAHGRLLDPVGHLPYRRGNPAVFCDVVEQLEVVDIHRGTGISPVQD